MGSNIRFLFALICTVCALVLHLGAFRPSPVKRFEAKNIKVRGRIPRPLAATAEEPIEEIKSQDEFSQATKNSEVVVVDFQKSHCKPCIRVAPEFQALAKKFYGKGVLFYKIDADTSKESLAILKSEGIRSVPTFQVWKGGLKLDSIQGAHVDEVEELVENLINVKK